jgi:hypothetical protein
MVVAVVVVDQMMMIVMSNFHSLMGDFSKKTMKQWMENRNGKLKEVSNLDLLHY